MNVSWHSQFSLYFEDYLNMFHLKENASNVVIMSDVEMYSQIQNAK